MYEITVRFNCLIGLRRLNEDLKLFFPHERGVGFEWKTMTQTIELNEIPIVQAQPVMAQVYMDAYNSLKGEIEIMACKFDGYQNIVQVDKSRSVTNE
jgi:hypothetical protein